MGDIDLSHVTEAVPEERRESAAILAVLDQLREGIHADRAIAGF
ncbi:hypothetical protein [Peterkaempfera sp. SMS 1(5)a]